MAYSFYSRQPRLSRMDEAASAFRAELPIVASILKITLCGNQGNCLSRYLPVAQTHDA